MQSKPAKDKKVKSMRSHSSLPSRGHPKIKISNPVKLASDKSNIDTINFVETQDLTVESMSKSVDARKKVVKSAERDSKSGGANTLGRATVDVKLVPESIVSPNDDSVGEVDQLSLSHGQPVPAKENFTN